MSVRQVTDEAQYQQCSQCGETGEWLPAGGIGNPFEVGDITDWFTANWKWVLGVGGGAALLLWFLRKK